VNTFINNLVIIYSQDYTEGGGFISFHDKPIYRDYDHVLGPTRYTYIIIMKPSFGCEVRGNFTFSQFSNKKFRTETLRAILPQSEKKKRSHSSTNIYDLVSCEVNTFCIIANHKWFGYI
jgi:hypothetical protein